MTFAEFARGVIEDPLYHASIVTRAQAGTLPVEIEMLILEQCELAGGRSSMSLGRAVAAPAQSATLALIRPSAAIQTTGEMSHD